MISDKTIVINRCTSLLCRHAVILVQGVTEVIDVWETGSETCEHLYDPAQAVSVRRDVLVLHALWTAGRHAGIGGADTWAHVLADRLGYRPGDHVPDTEVPLQFVDVRARSLTWQGMCAAFRVARATRDQRPVTSDHVDRWAAIAEYLGRWQHYVL